MRLLLVYDTLYPETIGGIEHRAAELARALTARGHQVTLAAFVARAAAPSGAVRVLALGPRRLAAGDRRGGRDVLRLGLAMLRLPLADFDLIEAANVPFAHLVPLALRCRLAGRPLLVTWHEVWGGHWRRFSGRWTWRFFAAAEWLTAQLGDDVNAVSQLTARRLAGYRRAGAVSVIPNGIDIARVREAARGVVADGPPLVSAGRLLADKRIDLLLRAVARMTEIATDLPRVLLTVIGDGPESSALGELSRTLGLADRVVFTGKLAAAEQVWRQSARARIAVHPSRREGFGIFPLEAMALGLPVVYCTADDSAVPELVRDHSEGLAVPPEPESLAQTLLALLRDEPTRARLSAAARLRAADYAWDTVAGRFEAQCLALLER